MSEGIESTRGRWSLSARHAGTLARRREGCFTVGAEARLVHGVSRFQVGRQGA